MKLSISLSEDEVAFIDDFAARSGLGSRSSVIQYALRNLLSRQLGDDYQAAWDDALLPEKADWGVDPAALKVG